MDTSPTKINTITIIRIICRACGQDLRNEIGACRCQTKEYPNQAIIHKIVARKIFG